MANETSVSKNRESRNSVCKPIRKKRHKNAAFLAQKNKKDQERCILASK